MTKEAISVINTITVPQGMENEAEAIRDHYVAYFKAQQGFVSSSFYRSITREDDGGLRYVNIVVWSSAEAFEKVVNLGFQNADGENADGKRVLGKGFPEPIGVSPGQFVCIDHNS